MNTKQELHEVEIQAVPDISSIYTFVLAHFQVQLHEPYISRPSCPTVFSTVW